MEPKKIFQISTCPKCSFRYFYQAGEKFPVEQKDQIDVYGEQYRPEAIECCQNYRRICSLCNTSFCTKCNRYPYHFSITCEEYQRVHSDGKESKVFCRFCVDNLPTKGLEKDVCHHICWRKRCEENLKSGCMHVCECGHSCCGVKDEKEHFGCALCQDDRKLCILCVEMCSDSPSIVLKCGHTYHKECIISFYKKLDENQRFHIPKCFIGCNELLYHDCIKDIAQKWIDYYKKVKEMIEIKMMIEDTKNEKDHVNNINDKYFYHNPLLFAENYFVFYICNKCKQIFNNGHKDDQDLNENSPHLCDQCRNIKRIICKKHGSIGMVYMCMCCNSNTAVFKTYNGVYLCKSCRELYRNKHQCFDVSERILKGYCFLCEQQI